MTNTHYSHSSGLQVCVTILSSDLTVYLLFLPFKPTKLLSLWNVWLEKCCTWVAVTFKTLLGPMHWLSGPGSVMYVCVVLSVFYLKAVCTLRMGRTNPRNLHSKCCQSRFNQFSCSTSSVLSLARPLNLTITPSFIWVDALCDMSSKEPNK